MKEYNEYEPTIHHYLQNQQDQFAFVGVCHKAPARKREDC
jgi:hypothetical protein